MRYEVEEAFKTCDIDIPNDPEFGLSKNSLHFHSIPRDSSFSNHQIRYHETCTLIKLERHAYRLTKKEPRVFYDPSIAQSKRFIEQPKAIAQPEEEEKGITFQSS